MNKLYHVKDCGCYVDGAHGIYTVDAIIAVVNAHGAKIEHEFPSDTDCGYDGKSFSTCEFAGEFEDEADDYMNEHFAVDGAHWGRSEQGDWGLWPIQTPQTERPQH